MFVTVNGGQQQYPNGITVIEIIQACDLEGKRFALEINADIIPRSRYQTHQVNEGDIIEIVHAIGGG